MNGAAGFFQGKRAYDDVKELRYDLVSLHWGLMTKRHRDEHRERWNKIYGEHSGGKNPYGLWDWVCDETITPTIKPNIYL